MEVWDFASFGTNWHMEIAWSETNPEFQNQILMWFLRIRFVFYFITHEYLKLSIFLTQFHIKWGLLPLVLDPSILIFKAFIYLLIVKYIFFSYVATPTFDKYNCLNYDLCKIWNFDKEYLYDLLHFRQQYTLYWVDDLNT